MLKQSAYRRALLYAFLATALYALNAPLSKLIMGEDAVAPSMMAGLLYLGAGIGMTAVWAFRRG